MASGVAVATYRVVMGKTEVLQEAVVAAGVGVAHK